MNEEQRDEIQDALPKGFQIVDADEDASLVPGTLASWGEAAGHPMGPKGTCQVCGHGMTCPFYAFHDAMVSSVIRELDKIGALAPTRLDKTMHPEDMRGPVTWCRHDAERHGPEAGCTECRCIWPRGHESSELFQVVLAPKENPSDEDLNDPFGLWGNAPSYRCYMTRHKDCEPEGAEKGCTCACGHQEPVCACSTRQMTSEGELIHAEGCPAA